MQRNSADNHLLLHVVLQWIKSTYSARCTVVRPDYSVQAKIRLTECGTELITILIMVSFVFNSRYVTKHHSFLDDVSPAKQWPSESCMKFAISSS
jgi:hypothetical protein